MKKILSAFLLVVAVSSVYAQPYSSAEAKARKAEPYEVYTDTGIPVPVMKGPYGLMNSHGFTFLQSKFILMDENVDLVLDEEYFKIPFDKIQKDDIAIFRDPKGLPVFSSKVFKDIQEFENEQSDPILTALSLKSWWPLPLGNGLFILFPKGQKIPSDHCLKNCVEYYHYKNIK